MQSSLLPESRSSSQRNLMLFVVVMMGFFMMQSYFAPPPEKQPEKETTDILDKELNPETPLPSPAPEAGNETGESAPTADSAPLEQATLEQAKVEPSWVTIGSLEKDGPYRSLLTLSNRGAALVRLELNEPKYHDVQDMSGYLGQIVVERNEATDTAFSGCPVQTVGAGTPAEKGGLRPGDRIVGLTRPFEGKTETRKIENFEQLRAALLATKPKEKIELEIVRPGDGGTGETHSLSVELGRAPISVVRPIGTITTYEEYHDLRGLHAYDPQKDDQLSYLCTLGMIDDRRLPLPKSLEKNPPKHLGVVPRDTSIDTEIEGVNMRSGLWELVHHTENEAAFRILLPKWKLEITKTFRLARKTDAEDPRAINPLGAYHLNVSIDIKNLDLKERKVAYVLDGPSGLPLEGGWYPRKTGPGWGVYGIRDVVVKFDRGPSETISNNTVANDRFSREPWKDDRLDYIGVDSQYFQSTLIPFEEMPGEIWHARTFPIRVGEHNVAWSNLTDISYRTYSVEKTLKPLGDPDSSFSRQYTIFSGPKKPDVLSVYGLYNTISYGWFWFVAIPMLAFLHFIKTYLVFHYGLAIIVLTVCVRLLMFPMSRKQAISAAKNAALMPEIQKIKEKYKGNLEAQSKAQQELWKKHNFNPLSGCLGLFIQLPIFIGLYKSLSIDVELYGTPLISESFRWCRDLSAPDMLFDWSALWNSFGWTSFNTGQGMLALGPYFNILPLVTIVLFLIQQAVMMPPPTDDQARMQRNMMQFMMIFMGFLFFKVPSGLCIYFIATTLWGLAEKKLIPKYEFKPNEETGEHVLSAGKKAPSPAPKHPVPSEKEQMGKIGSMWKKLVDKASEPNTIGKSEKIGKNEKKKKKKK